MNRKRVLLRLAIFTLVIGCADGVKPISIASNVLTDSVIPAPVYPLQFAIDTVARGLEIPWSLAFVPDGRILVTERHGMIRVIQNDQLADRPWAAIDVYGRDSTVWPESGLMGIALASNFAESRHVFVLATSWRTAGDRTAALSTRVWRQLAGLLLPEARSRFMTQVIRLTDRNGVGVDPVVIVDDLPANHYHAGGGIAVGPDGKLYVSIGDALSPSLAAAPEVLAGKILRYEPDGSIPVDNPNNGSAVYASGLRNTQAFAWLPDGTMLAVEHGPSGMPLEQGRAGRDELNVIQAGRDYGWPVSVGWDPAASSAPPVWVWHEGIAPAGLAVWEFSDSRDSVTLLVSGLRGRVERLDLVNVVGNWHVSARDVVLSGAWGRLRTIHRDADGVLYVSTSNRDARGTASASDDLLLRLRLHSQPRNTPVSEPRRVP